MTVQKDVTKNIYVGNGSTRTFPFTFECPAEHPEYIKVYLMQDDGTALATSDYQLDMDARQITYPSSGTALPEGKKLVIMRELPLQQMMNLVNNGPYFAEDVELAFDENVMAMQQIAEKLNRSIIMSVDIDGDAFVNEVPFEAGKSFRIADDGKSIVLTEDPARVLPLAQEAYAQAQAQAQSASASAAAAAKSENSSAASASAADNSAQFASAYAANAAQNAELASVYKQEALTAKNDAAASATNAKASEANAKTSENNAEASKEAAQSAANSASNFATNARSSASEAKSYRDAASTYATNAKNYSENVNVFVPSVSSAGVLSWTNKAGLTNPTTVNIKGAKGDKGDPGTGITIKGKYDSLSALQAAHPKADEGDAYMAGTNLYVWNGSAWIDCGNIQGPAGNAATIKIGSVTTSAPGTSAQVTNSGTSSAAVLDFVLPKGKDGADGGVTVDAELSDTSTNAIQNKAVKVALDNRAVLDEANTFTSPNMFDDIYMADGIGSLKWYSDSPNFVVASINSKKYTGEANTAKKATKDGDGNVITSTYATKTELNSCVKTVNNVAPDTNGNVNITISGGGSSVTVDAALSSTSTNAIQNKAVYNALLDKVGTDIYSGFALIGAASTIAWRQGSQPVGSINASSYSGNAASATKATQDGAGSVITDTYAKKTDVSGMVKSVNNTKPDSNGNVTITVSGGGSNVTVDTALSATSTNAIANKAVYDALSKKLDKTGTAYEATKATQDGYGNVIATTYARKVDLYSYVKSVNNITPDDNGNVAITVSSGTDITVDEELSSTSTNAIANKAVYTALQSKLGKNDSVASATKATQDSEGNTIATTYVKFINGIAPDTSGNVNVNADGGGVSTSVVNNWSAQQTFQRLKFNFESFATSRISGTYDSPATSVAIYNVTGALTLDMSTLTGMLANGEATLFTAYIASNASYTLSITNAGTLKYVGSAADLAITSSGLLLNVLLTKNASGAVTSIAQASKLS